MGAGEGVALSTPVAVRVTADAGAPKRAERLSPDQGRILMTSPVPLKMALFVT